MCDRCCGQNAGNIQLFQAHGACRKWKYFWCVCYSCVGGWIRFISWHFLSPGWGNIQESSSPTVILSSPNKSYNRIFWEHGSKKSKELKEKQENRLFSFLPCIMSPLLCRAKTRDRGEDCSLMPSDHLHQRKPRKQERWSTLHRDVLPMLCWLSFFNPC